MTNLRRRLAAGAISVAVVSVVPAVAQAADDVSRAVASWRADGPGIYLAPSAAGHPLATSDLPRIDSAISKAGTPVFVAALGEASPDAATADLRRLIDSLHRDGTYVVVGTGGFLARSDVPGVSGQTDELVHEAAAAHRGDPAAAVVEFVKLVDAAAASPAGPAGSAGGSPGDVGSGSTGSGGGTSPWIPLVAIVGAGLVLVGLLRRGRARSDRTNAVAFADVRRAAEEDVTQLGEELTALPVPSSDVPGATADYQGALDAYERAKDRLAAARRPEDLSAVTGELEEGRWRLACVRARVAGQPMPERRPPCFFNPRHGPSATDVDWAPAGGALRRVPVCAADADRLARGDDPDSRLVTVGGNRMPYWQGPAVFGPYAGGFFGGWGGGSFLGGLLLGEMLAAPAAYGDYDPGYQDGGYDGGGYDGGGDFADGFDGGGADWGGGDWSGGGGSDWGGGDFGGGGGDWGGGDF